MKSPLDMTDEELKEAWKEEERMRRTHSMLYGPPGHVYCTMCGARPGDARLRRRCPSLYGEPDEA